MQNPNPRYTKAPPTPVAAGDMIAVARSGGELCAIEDGQIAAIAHSRGAALATRNVRDFAHCGIKVLNPWNE